MKKIFLFFGIIAVDQFFKYLAIHDLLPSLGGLFIEPVCNPFIAWSIPLQDAFFFTVWILAVTFLVVLAKKMNWDVFLVMILGGAASNFIDRIRFDCVIDFIQVGSFPTFNLADAFITVGVVLFLIKFLKKPKEI